MSSAVATGGPAVPAESVAAYRERGWAVVPGVFAPTELRAVIDALTGLARAEMTDRPADSFTVDASPDGVRAPRKIDYPFLKCAAVRTLALDPRLGRIAAAFLGQPGHLIRDQVFYKPPQIGSAKPYHQENAALGFGPPDRMLVLWLALDDADADNGCLRFIDGSHHHLMSHHPVPGQPYHLVPPTEATRNQQESLVPVEAGGVVVIHSQTLHASHANGSSRRRLAYSAHWVTADAQCTSNALRDAYSRTVGSGRYRHSSP